MPVATKSATPVDPGARTGYGDDLYSWAMEQGALLRAGRLAAIDRENIAEEIESLGRSEFDKLVSFYRLLLRHMLKWDHHPQRRSRSWVNSIAMARDEIVDVIEDSPSLGHRVDEAIERAYRKARHEASPETGLDPDAFPAECPYDRDALLSRHFDRE